MELLRGRGLLFGCSCVLPCWFLFSPVDELVKADAVDHHDFEAYAGDVAHCSSAGSAYAFYDHFVMFVDDVEGAVSRQKGTDDAAVFDELGPYAFAYGAVRLFGFDADFLKNYASCLGCALQGVDFFVEHQLASVVVSVAPSEVSSFLLELAGGEFAAW